MEINNERLDGITVVAAGGRFDATGAPEMEQHCKELIERGDRHFLLDLNHVSYISSAGLRSLLVVAKTLKAAGGVMVLCHLSAMVLEVMEISGFDKIFTVAADREAALTLLKSAA